MTFQDSFESILIFLDRVDVNFVVMGSNRKKVLLLVIFYNFDPFFGIVGSEDLVFKIVGCPDK